ncbi:hypothetical protein [Vibrio marisflavi]|uniref:Uncharacterized protein n=1 Tax=Vibrio marisflavi CECT 7928 TaxID=634439 RepID=A0ABM9A9C4_9VIBR|nr:hypothetical protein [Vibrio marisflavi]CAH0542975.1 hypothetical protein VMF7928_04341 [Vibrio marisflavi CECT 7928]
MDFDSEELEKLYIESVREIVGSVGGQQSAAKLASEYNGYTISQGSVSKVLTGAMAPAKVYNALRFAFHQAERENWTKRATIMMVEKFGFCPIYHDVVRIDEVFGLFAGCMVLGGKLHIAVRTDSETVETVDANKMEFL